VSFDALRNAIMPYQAEIIAADLDDVLFPYLPHQQHERDLFDRFGLRLPLFDEEPALLLRKAFGSDEPQTLGELAHWLLKRCGRCNEVAVFKNAREEPLVSFDLSSLCVRGRSGEVQKSMMSVVLAPLYPKGTARYGEKVAIVLTRHSDAMALPRHVRDRIRNQANASYRSHGLPVGRHDVQPAGLWIPGENIRIVKL
jgi:hypothetical protein